jgi:hypothetical protein
VITHDDIDKKNRKIGVIYSLTDLFIDDAKEITRKHDLDIDKTTLQCLQKLTLVRNKFSDDESYRREYKLIISQGGKCKRDQLIREDESIKDFIKGRDEAIERLND